MAEDEVLDELDHHFNAEAKVLSGKLERPFLQEIKPQAYGVLPAHGGYIAHRTEIIGVEKVVSIRSSYTHVAGSRSTEPCEGWSTLTTAVIEGLNVLEVLTADRVVGQIVTTYPAKGHVPSISFRGTRFENLCIAGYPVKPKLNLGILGPRPADDQPYGLDSDLTDRIASQYDRILESEGLPAELFRRYNQLSSTLGSPEAVECSLVDEVPRDYPEPTCGHIFHIPGFGWVSLATVNLSYNEMQVGDDIQRNTTVELRMIDFKLDCAASGRLEMCCVVNNGRNWP
jgi:hypothetical protein